MKYTFMKREAMQRRDFSNIRRLYSLAIIIFIALSVLVGLAIGYFIWGK
jgi:uncharacterized membrane protein